MLDVYMGIWAIGAVLAWCAWRELRQDNRRDAGLLLGSSLAMTAVGTALA